MAKVIWTEPALQQLDDIAEYIAIENLFAAKQLVQKVFNAVSPLESFPKSGHVPAELPESNYLEVTIPPCRIFYRVIDGDVHIIFTMRQEQELKKFIIENN